MLTVSPSTTPIMEMNTHTGLTETIIPSTDSGRSTLEIGVAASILVVLIFITLAGNMTVIVAATTYHKLKEQHSNIFIVNLAIADLFVALLVMVCSLVALVTNMRQGGDESPLIGNIVCSLQCAMNYCLIVVSMMTLGFVSVDRLIHIIYPLRYIDLMTVCRIRVLIVWTWVQGFIIGFIPVGANWIHYDYHELVCAIEWSSDGAGTYVIIAFITCFVAPGLTMVICYCIILKEIQKSMSRICQEQGKMRPKRPLASLLSTISSKSLLFTKRNSIVKNGGAPLTNQQQPTSTNQHKRIIRSLLAVVFVFFICMTPFCVTKLIKVLEGSNAVAGWVNTVATFVQLAASACNPFIYGLLRTEFRKAFRAQYDKLLHKVGCRDHMSYKKSVSSSIVTAPVQYPSIFRKRQPVQVPSTSVTTQSSIAELHEHLCDNDKLAQIPSSPSIQPETHKEERIM